jgi:pyruvate,water dikinase
MMRGFKAGTSYYGALLDYLDVAVINRFIYMTPRPVGAPKGSKGPPPKAIFKLLTRLHPEIRRRVRRSGEVFQQKIWREDLRLWDNEVRPTLAAEAKALLADDLESATNAQLAAHVRRATAFLDSAVYFHHRFNVCVMVPLGDFLVQAMEWTGLSATELLHPMRGLSPVSAGGREELLAVRSALQSDPAAMRILMSDRSPADALSALMTSPEPVGPATRRYVDEVGFRVMGGYDVADRHAREYPEMLLKIIRATVSGDESSRRVAAQYDVERVRDKVPAQHRAAFDELLAEAQLTYRVRDERVFHGDALATGLARRAILAAGARLRSEGRAHDAEDLIDATPDEIVSLLEGRGGPTADELAERSRWRRDTPLTIAPTNLGNPPSA